MVSQFENALFERMISVGLSLEALGNLPQNAEEFANCVYKSVSDSLGGALLAAGKSSTEIDEVFGLLGEALIVLNRKPGRHPDDNRPEGERRL